MKLYAACPQYAPDIEATLFLAKDDTAALEHANILLNEDARNGYESPFVALWEIKADIRQIGGVARAVEV